MADTTAQAMTTLAHVNVPPAQTWNYLRINDIKFEVPKPDSKGDVPARLPELFGRIPAGIGNEAVSWIEHMAGDSHYVEVPRGTVRQSPIVAVSTAETGDVADTGVNVREGAEATVIMVSRTSNGPMVESSDVDESAKAPVDPATSVSANLMRINVERGAKLHVLEFVALDDAHTHIDGLGISAAEGAEVDVRQYALGGAKVAMGLGVDLFGNSSRLQLDTRYFAHQKNVLDINHAVYQRGRLTRADIVSQGLLADAAHKTMRETIDLQHGAKGSKGNETETVLVEGDEVVNKTLPVILCDEDDVAGNHGASIGSISPEQEIYLQDRGLSEDQITKLFARAIFDDAFIHAGSDEAIGAILDRAETVLGQDTAVDMSEGLGLSLDDIKSEEDFD